LTAVEGNGGVIYDRILADMRTIWGEMAIFMLRKRLKDANVSGDNITKEELTKVIDLLREKTLPAILGKEGAEAKARQYLSWLESA